MPEKLLTIQEVAGILRISEEEVKRLVDIGEIPAYRIGGTFLRFRKEQIDAIRQEVECFEATAPAVKEAPADAARRPAHPYTDLEAQIRAHEPAGMQYDYTFAERCTDLWYFSDFYVVAALLITVIVYIITT